MNFTIYIESLDNFPLTDGGVSAYLGYRGRGADIKFFEDIDEVPFSKWHIVVGCIESTVKYFQRVGVDMSSNINIPEQLKKYSYRFHGGTTLGNVEHMMVNDLLPINPLFVKPMKNKQFIAGVVKDPTRIKYYYGSLPEDTEVMWSTTVNFVTEYRCYVTKGELKGIYNYNGDIRIFPDVKVIDQMISDYTSAPQGYGLDVGVLDTGETAIVEVNDGWALGNYGLPANLYASLLSARWLELVKSF